MSRIEEENRSSQGSSAAREAARPESQHSAGGDLPTVELVSGAFYWIKKSHEAPDMWTIARWEVGSFWDLNGRETTPRVISGPIKAPADHSADDGAGRSALSKASAPSRPEGEKP